MLKKLPAVLVTACIVLSALFATACSAGGSGSLSLATGNPSGTYSSFGNAIADYCTANSPLAVETRPSRGARDNVEMLANGEVDMAFCQSDVMAYAYNGIRSFEETGAVDCFSMAAALYSEPVHIVTCDPEIDSVKDLKGKKVSVGEPDSGTLFNAIDILRSYGLSRESIDPEQLSFEESAEALAQGKIDAAFLVSGSPNEAVRELAEEKDVYLAPIDQAHVDKLLKASDFYCGATVPAGTYQGVDQDTPTVAVTAGILVADSVPDDQVYCFLLQLFQGAQDPEQAGLCAKYGELDPSFAASFESIPYHPGAVSFFAEMGIQAQGR